jgi:hypothetical protein
MKFEDRIEKFNAAVNAAAKAFGLEFTRDPAQGANIRTQKVQGERVENGDVTYVIYSLVVVESRA